MPRPPEQHQSVAEYLCELINQSPLSQTEIARRIGLERANVLSHIKKGRVRLPLKRIGPLASALGLDPFALLARVMTEYQPETWQTLLPLISPPLAPGEQAILSFLQEIAGRPLPAPSTPEQLMALNRLARALAGPG